MADANAEPIRVEDGVPFPERPAPYTTARAVFPFATMKIGQSFETPKPSVASAATKYMNRMAARGEAVYLLVRKQKNGKYRCWRKDPKEAPERVKKPRKTRATRKAPAKPVTRAAAVAPA